MGDPARQDLARSRWARITGLFADDYATDSYWIREAGVFELPDFAVGGPLTLRGEMRPGVAGAAGPLPALEVTVDGRVAARLPGVPGPFRCVLPMPATGPEERVRIEVRLRGVAWSNAEAWLGRVTAGWPLPPALARRWREARRQARNRQVRILALEDATGEAIYDFSNRHSPYNRAFARRHLQLGLNVVGFHTADLGVGESARCMVKAADAAGLPVAVVPLRLHCLNAQSDQTLAPRLQAANPHRVNVFHLDAPQSRDIDHHHGPGFRAGRYNIGYWAWELPDFPDAWLEYADYFDEIWCPSEFVRTAVAAKLRQPVFAMPHAIEFARPAAGADALREKFGLPRDRFLFLFLYDLNSYSERKNARAVLEAYRRAFGGAAGERTGVVIKTHSRARNPEAWAALEALVAEIPGARLLGETLPRAEVYELQAACDAFVSLHRAEGFGLAVAEAMYLGKPVVSTDWSATAEYLDGTNGCPVRATLTTIERSAGPYAKGQVWAEPDVAQAAEWMQRLVGESGLAERLGAAARRTIEERFSPAVIGARYRRRLEAIASW